MRHAVGVRRALDDEWDRAVQDQIDERRRIVIEHDRVANEGRHIRREPLRVEPMTGRASAGVHGTAWLPCRAAAQCLRSRIIVGSRLLRGRGRQRFQIGGDGVDIAVGQV
jgi:hypothetical protein